VLNDNNIGLRVLSAEAGRSRPSQLAPDDMRALGVDIEVVDADPDAAEGCELVRGLGRRRKPFFGPRSSRVNANVSSAGHQPGPHRVLAEAETEAIDSVLEHVGGAPVIASKNG